MDPLSFTGSAVPAPVGGTGKIILTFANATPDVYPITCTVNPDGGAPVIVESGIMVPNIEILNVPIGKFHLKIENNAKGRWEFDKNIDIVLPDNSIIPYNTYIIMYPKPV